MNEELVNYAKKGRNRGTPPLLIRVEKNKAEKVASTVREEYMVWGKVEETASNIISVNSILEKQLKSLAEDNRVRKIEIESVGSIK